MSFTFVGRLPASKSMLNRALVCQSFHPELLVHGESECDDVRYMRSGLQQMFANQKIDCGQAGTVFRFLALRASRIPGEHFLTGSGRLLERPQTELMPILGQLGCEARMTETGLWMRSRGWNLVVDGLQISAARSSQFASAVLLSAWQYSKDLHFHINSQIVSEGYWRMTLAMMRELGMQVTEADREYTVKADQRIRANEIHIEPDMSSAFAVAALAAVAGEATFREFPRASLQPDASFTHILKELGVPVREQANDLKIGQCTKFQALDVDLAGRPDLFPVLSVLAALATGESRFVGTRHIAFKESDRIAKTAELLGFMGAAMIVGENEVRIRPVQSRPTLAQASGLELKIFPTAEDHRMVMAVAVARAAGFGLRPDTPSVVRKSCPEYLQIAGAYL